MVDIKYANAYSEVLEILKYISIEDYNKIPKEKIELFETNANYDYSFQYNPNKTLNEQNVSKIAKGIIAILFRDYWSTEIQREKIISKQNYDRLKIEEEKKKRYNVDTLFSNKKNIIINEEKEEKSLVEIKDKKWYKRLFLFFRKFFV